MNGRCDLLIAMLPHLQRASTDQTVINDVTSLITSPFELGLQTDGLLSFRCDCVSLKTDFGTNQTDEFDRKISENF